MRVFFAKKARLAGRPAGRALTDRERCQTKILLLTQVVSYFLYLY